MSLPIRIAVCACVVLMCWSCSSRPPELVDAGRVPDFAVTDQRGQAFVSKEVLLGKPWVVNFLFTSCPSVCPELATSTTKLQDEIEGWALKDPQNPRAHIVSISVDPVTDTPEKLSEFAGRFEHDARLWSLVRHSDYDTMNTLVTQGFMQPLIRSDLVRAKPGEEKYFKTNPTPTDTAHSVRFLLVDGNMHIRGLYDRSPEGIKSLGRAMRYLADHPEASIQAPPSTPQ